MIIGNISIITGIDVREILKKKDEARLAGMPFADRAEPAGEILCSTMSGERHYAKSPYLAHGVSSI